MTAPPEVPALYAPSTLECASQIARIDALAFPVNPFLGKPHNSENG